MELYTGIPANRATRKAKAILTSLRKPGGENPKVRGKIRVGRE